MKFIQTAEIPFSNGGRSLYFDSDDFPSFALHHNVHLNTVFVSKVVKTNRLFAPACHAAKFLKYKVETGPFYALRPRSTTLGTIGGVRVNEKFEAVTRARTPVAGLYVTGNNAGGIYGDSYPTVEGMSAAFAYISGRIAGAAAADYTAGE